ncbi:MAG: hypothetical protein ACFB13_05990 [Kiloniellaceae bacterium]|mgnify:CR=1 FL=1
MAVALPPSDPCQAAPADTAPQPLRLLGGLKATGAAWLKRRALRRELKRLLRIGPHMVADVGLSPEAARREADKPFWKG